jgi:hypothetical protein
MTDTWFDYENQAWVVDGVYNRCGHPETMDCRCYGKQHAGEHPARSITEQYSNVQAQATERN